MPSIKELKTYQKGINEDDFFTSRIYRKISVYFTWFFLKLRFSANAVTLIGFFSDLLAILFLLKGHWVAAAVLMQFFIVIDCVDGEIARYRRRNHKESYVKKYGEFLDDILGVLGFYFVILLAVRSTDMLAGIIASYSLLIVNFSSALSGLLFNKKEIAKKTQESLLKKTGVIVRGRIGFTADIQRTLITLAILFQSSLFLWTYSFGALVLVGSKLWIYRNH